MTSLFGNICLALAALVSGQMISSVFNYKPPHGGDGGAAGYPIWMLLVHVALLGLLMLASIAIARKGGFDWVSPNAWIRYLLVAAGLLMAVYTLVICAMSMERPGALSDWVRLAMQVAIPGIPIVLIASGFFMLNGFLSESIPGAFYKWPLLVVFGSGILVVGATIMDGIATANEGAYAAQIRYENAPAIKAQRLQQIEESDVTEDMVRILEFTGAIYPAEVREKAGDKIKSHPQWQKELVFLLENEHALEAFNFLASNEVVDKNMFLQPINTGVLAAADWIRHSIQGTSPSSFHRDEYSDEVGRVLRTVEKFEGLGVDYLPAVRELRAALDEPRLGGKPDFDCAGTLDQWILRH